MGISDQFGGETSGFRVARDHLDPAVSSQYTRQINLRDSVGAIQIQM